MSACREIRSSYYRLLAGQQQGSLIGTFEARHPSIAERLAAGKATREKVPRTATPDMKSPTGPTPSRSWKAELARVQKLVPVRYARMLASPFAFLRGSAAVMASDLPRTPVTGLAVAACGDMHVSNFGVFASAERTLVFGINDFDEVHPGPWEWDVKRLAASAAVAIRFMGGDEDEAEDAARASVRSYRKRIRRYAEMGYLEVWYDHIDERAVLKRWPGVAAPPRLMDKARQRPCAVLEKLTEEVAGEHRIIEDVPLIVRETHTESGMPAMVALDHMLRSYLESLASTGVACWRAIASSIRRARWWAWAASAPVAGWSCCRASTTRIRCSCRSSRPRPRCWPPMSIMRLANE